MVREFYLILFYHPANTRILHTLFIYLDAYLIRTVYSNSSFSVILSFYFSSLLLRNIYFKFSRSRT